MNLYSSESDSSTITIRIKKTKNTMYRDNWVQQHVMETEKAQIPSYCIQNEHYC